MFDALSMQSRREFARRIRANKYEVTATGIYVPGMDMNVNSVYDVEHRRGGDLMHRQLAPNVVPTEGKNDILNAWLHAGTQTTAWYLGIYEGNVTPLATLTAATVTSTLTECTAYDETARVAFNEAAASAGSMDNSANRAVFTMNATKTIYGGFLVSASAKSATTGVLASAAPFPVSRPVIAADEISVKFTISLS